MTEPLPDLAKIRRNSRRAAAISLIGGLVVIAALGVSFWQVGQLQSRRLALAGEAEALEKTTARQRLILAQLTQTIQLEQEKRELAGAQIAQGNATAAQQILQKVTPAASPAAAAVAASVEARRVSVPRVYFQVRSRAASDRVDQCRGVLSGLGVRVPPTEVVSTGPSRTELRYFHAEDEPTATRIQAGVEQCLSAPVRVVFLGRYSGVNPLHFEVWVAPDA